MNVPANISAANLPRTYEAAKSALSDCAQIDECKEWSDKAAALASYAKQAEDKELENMAQRIRARAIRRAGDLLKQVEPGQGARDGKRGAGEHTPSRADMARDAGMSRHQQIQATRVANVPEQDFEKQVESEAPPTLSKLAQQGTAPRKEPILDLKGRDPKEFNRALHFIADLRQAVKLLEGAEIGFGGDDLTDEERDDAYNELGHIEQAVQHLYNHINGVME